MLVDPEVDHESVARGRWWETKLSVVDWSVPAPLQLKRRRYWRKHSPIQPPHYHDLLLRPSFPSRGRYGAMATKTTTPGPATLTVTAVDHGNHTSLGVEEVDKESWNDGLIGVRMAEDALQQFETDVGFHYSIMPDVVLQEFLTRHLDVGSEVTNEDLDKIRDIWLHRLHELVGEYVVPERPALKLDEDFRPRSALSSSEYDSEHSFESEPFPCTPTQKHNIEVRVQQSPPTTGPKELPQPVTVSARSPTPTSASPVHAPKQSNGRSRSASSLACGSFIPSTSSRSPSPPDFVFPAINANYQHLPPNLRKDDQGFYTPITPPGSPHRIRKEYALGPSGLSKSTSAASLLPPLLGENQTRNSRKASKTREIVDQLRSGGGEKKKAHTRARASSGSAVKDAASRRSPSGASSAGSSSGGADGTASMEFPTIMSPPKERTASSTCRRDSSASSSNARSNTPKQRSPQRSIGSASTSGADSSSSRTSSVSPDSVWSTPSSSTSVSSYSSPNTTSSSSQSHKRFPSTPSHPHNVLQHSPPHPQHLSPGSLAPPGVSPAGPGPNPFFAHPASRLSRPAPGQAPTAPPLLPVGYAGSAPHMPPGTSPQSQLHMHMQPHMHQVHQMHVPPQMQSAHSHGRGAGGHWVPVMPMGPHGGPMGMFPHLSAPHITGNSGMQHVAW